MIFLFLSDPKPEKTCKFCDTVIKKGKTCDSMDCRYKLAKERSIKPRSSKRAKQERDYMSLRESFLDKNPNCQRCGKPATEIHHSKGREGGLLTDQTLFIAICRMCHVWVENNPLQAKIEGWSLSRG